MNEEAEQPLDRAAKDDSLYEQFLARECDPPKAEARLAELRQAMADRDAARARVAELERFLGGNVCSAHPERTHGCTVCDPSARALAWYHRARALEAGLRDAADMLEACSGASRFFAPDYAQPRYMVVLAAARRLLGEGPTP